MSGCLPLQVYFWNYLTNYANLRKAIAQGEDGMLQKWIKVKVFN